MSKTKIVPIKYTTRDYDSIKRDLLNHAKRYYSDQWKDFSKSTINSLLLDSVSYIGDVLSYYVDYQANESFLNTAIEFKNIRNHARALGYKYGGTASSYGTVAIFCLVPANSDGTAPDFAYLPIAKRGMSFSGPNLGTFSLTEDVRFDNAINTVIGARFDPKTGATTHFAVKAFGQVVSGVFQRTQVDLMNSNFEKFRKVRVGGTDISEIVSVFDGDGNQYYEVENLAQEVIFLETTNKTAASDGVRSILKPYVAARRFVMEQDDTGTYAQFGFGSSETIPDGIVDPAQVAIKMRAKRSISKMSFDPSQLLGTTKLGISPSNTELLIVSKTNSPINLNVAVNKISSIKNSLVEFDNVETLSPSIMNTVVSSFEVTNEEPISGNEAVTTAQELKQRAKTYYATQNRAVTKQDYEAMIYNMPKKFGSVKRVNVVNDPSSTNRKLAIYLVGENSQGKLINTNYKIKQNIKNWIMQYKSINDTVQMYDTKIINFGIEYRVVVDERYSQFDLISKCNNALQLYFSNQLYIGEPVYITRLYSVLGKIDGIADVKKVSVELKNGGLYSSININLNDIISIDGSYIKTPKNAIMELKYPSIDIKGILIK